MNDEFVNRRSGVQIPKAAQVVTRSRDTRVTCESGPGIRRAADPLDLLEQHGLVGLLASYAQRFDVAFGQVIRPGKVVTPMQRRAVTARREFILFLRTEGYSWPSIGRLLGMDHSSAMYAAGALKKARLR